MYVRVHTVQCIHVHVHIVYCNCSLTNCTCTCTCTCSVVVNSTQQLIQDCNVQ